MKNTIYPKIVENMDKKGETLKDIANLINLDISQVSRKLTGYIGWSIDEIKILCEHYNTEFEELFRKENKNEKN